MSLPDDEAKARLEAVKARVRASEAMMREAFGCGQIVMMAVPGKVRESQRRDRKRRGMAWIAGEVPNFTLVDGLIRRKLIDDKDSRNKKLLNAAALRFLTDELKKL